MYTYGTLNSIIVEIQPDSTNIKNDPRMPRHDNGRGIKRFPCLSARTYIRTYVCMSNDVRSLGRILLIRIL